MREIKFRAKRKSGEWIVGSLFVEDGMGITYILSGVNTHYETNYLQVEVVPKTIGQFTGLLDCEGREVYEGDVVRHENCICLVVYNSTRFASFALRKDGWAFDHYFGEAFEASECHVIGNVHDSPELLEADHERD